MHIRMILGALVAAFLLTGCYQHYWSRGGSATLDQFAVDHRECMATNNLEAANRPGYGVVDEQAYRRCLLSRGWARYERPSTDVPLGYYRGYEEDEPGAVKIGELPEQPSPPGWTARRYQFERPR